MSEITLEVKRREAGRSTARALRRQSIVPGIYYFHGEEPIPIAAHELALRPLIYTAESHLVNMKLDDGTMKTCVLKDLSFDPISDRPVHFDLQGVSADEMIRVEVPVALVGSSIGQREGGIVDFVIHKVEVECLPKDMPDHIEIDISQLQIGDSIHVRDLSIENVTFLTADDATIVAVTPPRVAVEPTPSEAAAAAEPEVITRERGAED